MELKAIEIVSDDRVGQGGFLSLRRMKLRLVGADGTRTKVGTWDYVEREVGLDAVVVALWRRRAGAVEVLLRAGVRVPVQFGRPQQPVSLLFPELVAGILERGEESDAAAKQRAADEAKEEAGLVVDAARVQPLGPPMFPTPGMCAEQFHFVHAEVEDQEASAPEGDGSPFEEGAQLEWVALDEALRRCARGEIQDLKTEVGLRRLRELIR